MRKGSCIRRKDCIKALTVRSPRWNTAWGCFGGESDPIATALKITNLKRKLIFQTFIFGFHNIGRGVHIFICKMSMEHISALFKNKYCTQWSSKGTWKKRTKQPLTLWLCKAHMARESTPKYLIQNVIFHPWLWGPKRGAIASSWGMEWGRKGDPTKHEQEDERQDRWVENHLLVTLIGRPAILDHNITKAKKIHILPPNLHKEFSGQEVLDMIRLEAIFQHIDSTRTFNNIEEYSANNKLLCFEQHLVVGNLLCSKSRLPWKFCRRFSPSPSAGDKSACRFIGSSTLGHWMDSCHHGNGGILDGESGDSSWL